MQFQIEFRIDLSSTPRNIYVGNDSVYFTGSFDGRGHTVTMAITASDYNVGLFSALGEGTTIQNLNLAGTISSSLYDEASANRMKIGSLAIVDMGASLTNVNSSVAVTYDAKFAGGYCGGLVALNAGQKSVYYNCNVSGSFTLKGMRYIGGIIGLIDENSKGEMRSCTHTGRMTLDFSEASATGKQRIGGIVGCNDKGYWTYTSSSNTGDIDYKCKSDDSMYALGGFVGDGSGTYTDCFNTGNITDLLGTKTVRGTRRIGGFIGCNTNDGYAAKMTGCYNTGAVTGEVQKAECVQSIYVSEKVIESGATDAVVCDQATKDASKDATVKATIFTK